MELQEVANIIYRDTPHRQLSVPCNEDDTRRASELYLRNHQGTKSPSTLRHVMEDRKGQLHGLSCVLLKLGGVYIARNS